jgi:subtilisin family serine protease
VLSTVPWTNENSVTTEDGTTYLGNWITNSGRSPGVSRALVDGGLCDSVGAWAGQVVLCARGVVTFLQKVTNVQDGAGVAAVIYNNAPGGFDGTLDPGSSTLPAIGVSQADGQSLLGKLGEEVTVVSQYELGTPGYDALDGTSMATPHVSGIAALLWSHFPTWTNADIRRTLQASAADLGYWGIDQTYGFGVVQALNAYTMANTTGTPPEPPGIVLNGTGAKIKGNKRQVTLTWTGGAPRVVTIFRNDVSIVSAIVNSDPGTFIDLPVRGGTFVYKVCDTHAITTAGPICSDPWSITF